MKVLPFPLQIFAGLSFGTMMNLHFMPMIAEHSDGSLKTK